MDSNELGTEIIRLRDRIHDLSNKTIPAIQLEVLKAISKVSDRFDTFIAGDGTHPGLKERIAVLELEQHSMRRRELEREDRDFKTRLVAIGSFLTWIGTMIAFFIQYLWKKATA